MVIKRLKGAKFGTDRIARVVTGYALYEEDNGYIAFSSDRDEFGILAPYIPCGGKRALQSILDAGGFCSFDGMEYVQELGVSRRTLRTDIAYLKRVYPDKLITHRGRYTGGLEWVE